MRVVNYSAILDALLEIPGPGEDANEEDPTPDRSGVEPDSEASDGEDA